MKLKTAGITFVAAAVAGCLGLSFGTAKPVNIPSYHAVRVIDGGTFETTEKQYYTTGTIVQQFRAGGNFNFESINDLKFIQ